jgi:hypothetical protein
VALYTKYGITVAGLCAVTLVPVVMHSYVDVRSDDGRQLQRLAPNLAGLQGVDTARGGRWAMAALDADQAIERAYGPDLTLFAARSYDAKRLYHHPELVVTYGQEFDTSSVMRFAPRAEIPVHVLSAAGRQAVYVVESGGTYIDNGLMYEVQTALAALIEPRRPVTLLFVHGRPEPGALSIQSPAVALLFDAIDSFRLQSVTGKGPAT